MTEKRKHTGRYEFAKDIVSQGKSNTALWPKGGTEQITMKCLKSGQKTVQKY